MSKLIIQGGRKLSGEVAVSGMKNAATPIIAATLLTREECIISNVPDITDVKRMLEIIQSLGGEVRWEDQHTVRIRNKNIDPEKLNKKTVKAMRSSILFLGSLLGRCGKVVLPEPGGCIIGNRPIDTHLDAFQKLGVEIQNEGNSYEYRARNLHGGEVILREFSVTATENILMLAACAREKTIIKMAAEEPHIHDLISFLTKMGVRIDRAGAHVFVVHPAKNFGGATHALIPDQIEVGTFAALAAATRSNLTIRNVVREHLDSVLSLLQRIGVDYKFGDNTLHITPRSNLKAFRLQALPYPGFPTDLQAPFGVLATQCTGTSLIQDPLYEGRLGYIAELVKMGANAVVCDPHRVLISGPTPLYGTEIKSLDLRSGATLLIAGLIAQGETIINEAEVLDRGYERLGERLNDLGASIQRVD